MYNITIWKRVLLQVNTESVLFVHKRLESNIIKSKTGIVIFATIKISPKQLLKIIQCYAPTTKHEDRKIKYFYDSITHNLFKDIYIG